MIASKKLWGQNLGSQITRAIYDVISLKTECPISVNRDRFQWGIGRAKDEEIRRPSLWAIRETRLTGKVRFVGVRWRWQPSVNEP